MAGTSERRVGRLRLKASSEAGARRGLIVLEDALRTASMPEADGGRVFVVRSLALGKFRAGQSSAGVALAIERRLGQLRTRAVYALDPQAARAEAVYFGDEAECSFALAARLARGEDVSAWFWPLAAPEWRATLPRDEALRRLLYAAARAQGGAVAVASMLRELRVRGGVEVMLAALRPADGPRLLQACEWREPPRHSAHAAASAAREEEVEEELTPPDNRARDLLARWAEAWGLEDARSLWLSALLLTEAKPARALDARLTSRALRLIKRVTTRDPAAAAATNAPRPDSQAQRGSSNEREQVNDEDGATPPHATTLEENASVRPSSLEKEGSAAESAEPAASAEAFGGAEEEMQTGVAHVVARAPTAVDAPSGSNESSREGEPPAPHDSQTGSAPASHGARAPVLSAGAGLFFLVPVMSRLGIASLLEESPRLVELDFPQRLLRHVCGRVGVPEDDPIWRLLAFEDEGRVRHAAEEIGEFASSPDVTPLVEEWTYAARRWCRRQARVGLRELVRREGRLLWTRTHIDVFFDGRHADVRIRRGGLDVDPGWVAWLGRVVLFHYREQGDGDW